ncbi:hypothetical protein [Bacillus sp. CECT 9360]|uniref:hypothetical protein n=1 Tax=Bacillus sp. CECT 9360 TaxID=2845821 RepID=UPI001E5BBA09|nr:hypothetical protein [Bacillus sp. CECT 9360]
MATKSGPSNKTKIPATKVPVPATKLVKPATKSGPGNKTKIPATKVPVPATKLVLNRQQNENFRNKIWTWQQKIGLETKRNFRNEIMTSKIVHKIINKKVFL